MRPLKLFALDGMKEFGEKVASKLSIELSRHKESTFHDGEVYAASEENVRGSDVFVIQSLYGDDKESVNDKLMKLLVFTGSLHDASAKQVTLVLPYYPYARQDRKTSSRAPITTKYLAHFFQSVYVRRVLTIDAHNPGALQNAYSTAHFDNLEASGLFAKFIARELDTDDLAVLSPDEGRLKQSRKFRHHIQQLTGKKVELACVDKNHDGDDIHANELIGSVRRKKVVILDDMISSGKTIQEASNIAMKNGALRIEAVCATHGLFVGKSNNHLDMEIIQNIVITDTIKPFRVNNGNILEKLVVLDTPSLFAEAIRRTNKGESISDLIEKNGIDLSFKRMSSLDLEEALV